MDEDFTVFTKQKSKQGSNTETKIRNSKYKVPKLAVKNTLDLTSVKHRNSTSRPKRSQTKMNVKNTKKITNLKMEATRPSFSHKTSTTRTSHQKVFDKVPDIQLQCTGSQCDVEEPKAVVSAHRERATSKKRLLQNRALLLSNTGPHDTNLQCHEKTTSIRYSRRMPVFPPVSSSHANARPVTSNQCRISLVGEGGSRKARFTRPIASQSVERKCLLNSPKLSVVSLKLPNIT